MKKRRIFLPKEEHDKLEQRAAAYLGMTVQEAVDLAIAKIREVIIV